MPEFRAFCSLLATLMMDLGAPFCWAASFRNLWTRSESFLAAYRALPALWLIW